CSRTDWEFLEMYILLDFCHNGNCSSFTQVRICFCIPAKYPAIKIKKVCRTQFWKRWRPDCPWLRRVMVGFPKRSTMDAPGSSWPRKITSDRLRPPNYQAFRGPCQGNWTHVR